MCISCEETLKKHFGCGDRNLLGVSDPCWVLSDLLGASDPNLLVVSDPGTPLMMVMMMIMMILICFSSFCVCVWFFAFNFIIIVLIILFANPNSEFNAAISDDQINVVDGFM